MSQGTIVPVLRLEAESGSTLYPGENGFSVVWGEAYSDSPELDAALDGFVASGSSAKLRCGALEIVGRLERKTSTKSQRCYKIAVESVSYGPPNPAA